MIKKFIFIVFNLIINNFYCSIEKNLNNFIVFNNKFLNFISSYYFSIKKQNYFYIDPSKIYDENGPLVKKPEWKLKIESLKLEKNEEDKLINFFGNSNKTEENKLLLFRIFYKNWQQNNNFNNCFEFLKKEENNSLGINLIKYGESSLIATKKAKSIYENNKNNFLKIYNAKKFNYWNNDKKAFYDAYEIYKVNKKIIDNIKNGKKGIRAFL